MYWFLSSFLWTSLTILMTNLISSLWGHRNPIYEMAMPVVKIVSSHSSGKASLEDEMIHGLYIPYHSTYIFPNMLLIYHLLHNASGFSSVVSVFFKYSILIHFSIMYTHSQRYFLFYFAHSLSLLLYLYLWYFLSY